MGNVRQIKVDESLIDVFGKIGSNFAEKIKKEYNLDEIFVSNALVSQILAGKYRGQKTFNFKIRKINATKGVLEWGR